MSLRPAVNLHCRRCGSEWRHINPTLTVAKVIGIASIRCECGADTESIHIAVPGVAAQDLERAA